MSEIGKRIKIYRDYLGMTLSEMGSHYEIPSSNLGYYEKNARTFPDKLAEALKLKEPPAGKLAPSLSWLMTGEGQMLTGYGVTPESQRSPSIADKAIEYAQRRMEQDVPRTLPEHIAQAYRIVFEVVNADNANLMGMDVEQVGLVIGIVAEQIALGRAEEAKLMLSQRVGTLLGMKSRP